MLSYPGQRFTVVKVFSLQRPSMLSDPRPYFIAPHGVSSKRGGSYSKKQLGENSAHTGKRSGQHPVQQPDVALNFHTQLAQIGLGRQLRGLSAKVASNTVRRASACPSACFSGMSAAFSSLTYHKVSKAERGRVLIDYASYTAQMQHNTRKCRAKFQCPAHPRNDVLYRMRRRSRISSRPT